MTEADRPAFARMLFALGDTFNEPVSELRAEAYFDALQDLPIVAVLDAGRAAIREATFFPRPVELRELVAGSLDDQAEIAWMAVQRLVRAVGFHEQPGVKGYPDWPDETTRRAGLELFGTWQRLCTHLPASGPELLGVAKQFKATYRAYAARDRREQTALPAGTRGYLAP